jgi:hypothetical protein
MKLPLWLQVVPIVILFIWVIWHMSQEYSYSLRSYRARIWVTAVVGHTAIALATSLFFSTLMSLHYEGIDLLTMNTWMIVTCVFLHISAFVVLVKSRNYSFTIWFSNILAMLFAWFTMADTLLT